MANRTNTITDLPFTTTGVKTANYTALDFEHVLCDTTGGNVTITLPASPVANSKVKITDVADSFSTTNYLRIGRNGNNIINLPQDFDLTIPKTSYTFFWSGTNGWLILDNAPNIARIKDVVFTTDTWSSASNVITTAEDIRTKNYTPNFTNSTILIESFLNDVYVIGNTNVYIAHNIKVGGSSNGTFVGSDDASSIVTNICCNLAINNTTGNAISIVLDLGVGSGGTTSVQANYGNNASRKSYIKITEYSV